MPRGVHTERSRTVLPSPIFMVSFGRKYLVHNGHLGELVHPGDGVDIVFECCSYFLDHVFGLRKEKPMFCKSERSVFSVILF